MELYCMRYIIFEYAVFATHRKNIVVKLLICRNIPVFFSRRVDVVHRFSLN